MSSLPDDEAAAADADAGLLHRLASGDRDALDELFRRHEKHARHVATAVAGGDLVVADDLIADAFAAVFRRAASNAPILNFRAYLSACIRNAHLAHLRERSRSSPASDQPWLFDAAVDDAHLADGIAAEHAIAALATLPAGWRELLWRVEVEGRSNAELATLMGKSHTAVSSMTHRARGALRRAFLDRHVPDPGASGCRWTREHLSRYVRNELSDRAAGRVQSHVAECATCASVLQDLESLNRRIGASLWPVVLVGAGPTLSVVPNPDGSASTPSADASPASSASPPVPPPAGSLAALAATSPTTIATVVGIAAVVVFAATAVAMKLTGADEAGDPSDRRPVAAVPGAAADALGQPAPSDADPPAGPLTRPAGPSSVVKAESSEDEEEEEEEEEEEKNEDRPRRPAPAATTTSTPPPTYDASIGSIDASNVSGQSQSVTFNVQMNSAGPRAGLVLVLAITIDSTDSNPSDDPVWRFAVEQVSGSGWRCRAPDGEDVTVYVYDPGTTLTCSYEFPDDNDPPPLEWDLLIEDPDGQVDAVTGSAQISVAGKTDPNAGNDTATF